MAVNVQKLLQIGLLVVCLAALVSGNGRRRGRQRHRTRGRGGGRRAGAGPPAGQNVTWTRQLGGQPLVSVHETAFIPEDHNIVIVRSNDNASASLGFQTTETYYGYAGSEPIVAIATRGNNRAHPCFLMNPDKTYEELVADVLSRNGSTVTTEETQELSALGTLMERSAVQALVRQNPMMRRVCRRNRMFDTRQASTTEPDPSEPTAASPRVLKTLTFYSVAEITFHAPRQRGRQGRRRHHRNRQNGNGRGHRRGGGRGGGRGAARRQGRRGRGGNPRRGPRPG